LFLPRLVLIPEQGEAQVYPFSEVNAITILGKNKLNIYHDKHIYQLKGDKRFNGLKYVNIFHRYRNTTKDGEQSTFLGL
jgi:hypothetical protein